MLPLFYENMYSMFQYKMHSSIKTLLPVITTDCLLNGWLPRVLCSTEIGMPTMPVLTGSGDAD
jgi:hypothetical protein